MISKFEIPICEFNSNYFAMRDKLPFNHELKVNKYAKIKLVFLLPAK